MEEETKLSSGEGKNYTTFSNIENEEDGDKTKCK